jgi:hypothetical protein
MFLEESQNTFFTMNSKASLPKLQWARGGRHETKGQRFLTLPGGCIMQVWQLLLLSG